jgi:hypothetical protein
VCLGSRERVIRLGDATCKSADPGALVYLQSETRSGLRRGGVWLSGQGTLGGEVRVLIDGVEWMMVRQDSKVMSSGRPWD